jgi:hypothetical protein
VRLIKYSKSVFRNLALVSQLGITMLTPIFLCLIIGYYMDKAFKTSYIILIFLLLGVLTGFSMVYKLVKANLERELEEDRQEKANKSKVAVKKTVVSKKRASRVFKENKDE